MGEAFVVKRSCGVNTNDATAVPGDIRSGKTAYVGGKKITGTGSMAKTNATSSISSIDGSTNLESVSVSSFDGETLVLRVYSTWGDTACIITVKLS